MAYPKNWRRYPGNYQLIVEAWGRSLLVEAELPTAREAAALRSRFYGFCKALERCPKADETGKKLWEISRGISVRINWLDGRYVDFVREKDKLDEGPVKIIFCQPDHDRWGDPMDQVLFQNGLKASPEEIKTQQAELAKKLGLPTDEEGNMLPTTLDKPAIEGLGIGLTEVFPQRHAGRHAATEQRQTEAEKVASAPKEKVDYVFTDAELAAAKDNPFTAKLLSHLAAKGKIGDATKLALRQMAAFGPESDWHKEAKDWLAGSGEGGNRNG